MTDHAERDLLLDLAYGELSERDARRVREHVALCASCRAELQELQGTRQLMSALPEVPAPERGERILLAAAREAAGRAGRPRRHWLVPAVALAATVTFVSVVSLRLAREQAGPLAPEDEKALMKPAPAAAPAAAPVASRSAEPAQVAAAKAAPARPGPAKDEAPREAASRYAQAPPAAPPPAAAPKRAADLALRRERAATNAAEPAAEDELALRDDAKGEGVVGGTVGSAAGQPAPAAAAPERKAAASAEARGAFAPAAPAAVVRTFPGCSGEARREIRRDLEGRVRRFAREGTAGGRAVRVELEFGPDGAITASRGLDLRTGEAVPPDVLPGLPRSAAQVDPDALPNCGP